jgi:hypothetical protein
MHSCKVIHTTPERLEEELAAFFNSKRTIALSSITQSSAQDAATGTIYVTVIIIYA